MRGRSQSRLAALRTLSETGPLRRVGEAADQLGGRDSALLLHRLGTGREARQAGFWMRPPHVVEKLWEGALIAQVSHAEVAERSNTWTRRLRDTTAAIPRTGRDLRSSSHLGLLEEPGR